MDFLADKKNYSNCQNLKNLIKLLLKDKQIFKKKVSNFKVYYVYLFRKQCGTGPMLHLMLFNKIWDTIKLCRVK